MKNKQPKQQLLYFTVFILSFTSLFCSCVNTNRITQGHEYIEIYFLKGYVNAAISCNKNFHISETDSLEDVYIEKSEYIKLLRLVNELQLKRAGDADFCTMSLQCNIHSREKVERLCIGQFDCIVLDREEVLSSDSLIYMLRKYSGYYNYFNAKNLITSESFKEVKIMGIPDSYQDLSEDFKTSSLFYAKRRIMPESLRRGSEVQ